MSAKLRVPNQHHKLLAQFVKLTSTERDALLGALKSEEITVSLDALADRVAIASGLDPDKTAQILELLVNLAGARESLGLSAEEFVAEFRHAIEVLDKSDLVPQDWATFESDIVSLLSSDGSFALTAKATVIMREYPHVYYDGRVLTDLRPVFGGNVEESPAALVAVHTLKIMYIKDAEPLSFFAALDRADVLGLIDVLQRALKKEDALRHLTDEKQVKLLEVKP
jgi:hypothetical protein